MRYKIIEKMPCDNNVYLVGSDVNHELFYMLTDSILKLGNSPVEHFKINFVGGHQVLTRTGLNYVLQFSSYTTFSVVDIPDDAMLYKRGHYYYTNKYFVYDDSLFQ